jgi:16S rRNA (guanine527-N7)-methyltransferase
MKMHSLAAEAYRILGIQLTPTQVELFNIYQEFLLEWNQHINLTSIVQPHDIETKHFLDSLSCSLAIDPCKGTRLVDVGTGAGFPGIPIKILYPQIQLVLVESVGKKAEFCRQLIDKLGLKGVEITICRAEECGNRPEFREKFDWVTARAVANLPILVEYLIPLAKVNGVVIAQKGHTALIETQQAEYAIHLLGGKLRKLQPVHIPGVTEDRYLVVIDKKSSTPKQYPRNTGVPSKHPLMKNN